MKAAITAIHGDGGPETSARSAGRFEVQAVIQEGNVVLGGGIAVL